MMGTLIERPTINQIFEHKYSSLLRMCDEELNAVKRLFVYQQSLQSTSGPILNKNMPKVAGMLRWSQELRERTELTMEKLKTIQHRLASLTLSYTYIHIQCMYMYTATRTYMYEECSTCSCSYMYIYADCIVQIRSNP